MKISIITSVYNNKEHIAEAIESVLNQTYKNIEYIIIDGASTDGTKEIIAKYIHKINRFISEEDSGVYCGLNKGIKIATGDIICFLHSDDFYLHDNVIEKVVECFRKYDCDGVYGDLIYVDQQDADKVVRYWNSGEYDYKKLKHGWMPPHPALFLKKDVYKKFGVFDTDYKISADYNFMLKILSSKEIKMHYLSNVLYVMRIGGTSNKSLKNILLKTAEDLKALKANNIGNIFALIKKNIQKIPQFFKKK